MEGISTIGWTYWYEIEGDASRNSYAVEGDRGLPSRDFLSKGNDIINHIFKTVLITAQG